MQSQPAIELTPRPDQRGHLLQIIMRDFRIMPQLALTIEQASRLWALDRETSRYLLDVLVGEGLLRRRRDGRYAVPGSWWFERLAS